MILKKEFPASNFLIVCDGEKDIRYVQEVNTDTKMVTVYNVGEDGKVKEIDGVAQLKTEYIENLKIRFSDSKYIKEIPIWVKEKYKDIVSE